MIGIVSLILLLMWVLLLFAIQTENDIFIFIASAGMVLISVYIVINGLEDTNNWVTQAFGVIQIGIGMIGLIGAPLSLLNKEE